jgi:hypothetical protein
MAGVRIEADDLTTKSFEVAPPRQGLAVVVAPYTARQKLEMVRLLARWVTSRAARGAIPQGWTCPLALGDGRLGAPSATAGERSERKDGRNGRSGESHRNAIQSAIQDRRP